MSTRTIIEINHDRLPDLREHPEIFSIILSELGSSKHVSAINEANDRGHPLDIGNGIRIVLQRHHSTRVTVKTECAEVKS